MGLQDQDAPKEFLQRGCKDIQGQIGIDKNRRGYVGMYIHIHTYGSFPR